MKKILLVLALLTMAMTASAQLYLGGSASAWRDTKNDHTTLSILPEIGYNLDQQLAVGVVAGLDYSEDDYTAFQISPYVRYNFLQSGIVSGFVDGSLDVISVDPKVGDSSTVWGIGLKPGIALKLSDHVSFVTHLGFLGFRHADKALANYVNGFGFGLSGNDLSIGFYYNF